MFSIGKSLIKEIKFKVNEENSIIFDLYKDKIVYNNYLTDKIKKLKYDDDVETKIMLLKILLINVLKILKLQ